MWICIISSIIFSDFSVGCILFLHWTIGEQNSGFISDKLILKVKEIPIFKTLIRISKFEYFKKTKIKNYDYELKNYLRNCTYKKFFLDINISKIWNNIGKEYIDLYKRWFNDFGVIKNDIISFDNIMMENEKFVFKEIIEKVNSYPYKQNEVKDILISIQNNDFSFKTIYQNLKEVANSTIAEYFVNLFFAQKIGIPPSCFKKYCRTNLRNGTLQPLSHAPGRGPDMYYFKDKKFYIIETTIHKTLKQVRNNELFNVIDHSNLKKSTYLNSEIIEKITEMHIFLITKLKSDEENEELQKKLLFNINLDLNNNRNKIKFFIKVMNFSAFVYWNSEQI